MKINKWEGGKAPMQKNSKEFMHCSQEHGS